jgi:hypothetical protein
MSGLLGAALNYRKQGLSIIPVAKNKKPLIGWIHYQKNKATEEEIRAWYKKWPDANIGIVTGAISGIAVIDIDTEGGRQAIQEYIPDSLVMPAANTPSGGQHLYFKCADKKLSNNARTIPGCDLRANGGYVVAPPSNNGNGKAYSWQEGLGLHQVSIPELPEAYLSFINSLYIYKGKNKTPQKSITSTNVHRLFIQGSRDNDLFHVANCLIKGGLHESNALQVLKILAKNCTPPFSENEIPIKVQSAIDRSERRQRNLSQDVREFVESTNGHFMSTDIHKSLDLSTKQEKKNVSEILKRLCDKTILERYGNKNGCFRRVDDVAEDIDFLNADDQEIKISLPFNIDAFVNTYPRNIHIIAGSPDSGKTAFLLNIVEKNMHKHKIYYFSSEMAEQEMKLRLSKFDRDLRSWKFHPKERVSNFADVIRTNDINIIDYLEVHEDFWRIGGMIRQIYDKLKLGIAIVAIQKDKGKEYGLGATRGLEKARLYLTMNPGELKIVKAKNWADPLINPNNMSCKFKLYQGCKFSKVGDWTKE